MIPLEDFEVYKTAMDIGELVWNTVSKWEYFAKKSLGDQIIRSADSIGLNIAEGYGRFHYKENRQFCWYARGSLFETKAANQKAFNRGLISAIEYDAILNRLVFCHKLLNAYIKSIGNNKAAG
ncbi:MAG: four helix bundle protein [Ferruginibacter sp.]